MNKIISVCTVFFVLLSGCTEQDNLQLIVANKEIDVVANPEDRLTVLFKIKPGQVCAVGHKIEQKVFTYRKVLCENGKPGYIVAKADKTYNLIIDK